MFYTNNVVLSYFVWYLNLLWHWRTLVAYRNSKCVKLCKLRYFEFIMTIVNIYVVVYRDPICVKLSLLKYLISHIFYCFIIVITKVHTGIVIVLSMIIILGRMLRLVKEINYILWTVLIFFALSVIKLVHLGCDI